MNITNSTNSTNSTNPSNDDSDDDNTRPNTIIISKEYGIRYCDHYLPPINTMNHYIGLYNAALDMYMVSHGLYPTQIWHLDHNCFDLVTATQHSKKSFRELYTNILTIPNLPLFLFVMDQNYLILEDIDPTNQEIAMLFPCPICVINKKYHYKMAVTVLDILTHDVHTELAGDIEFYNPSPPSSPQISPRPRPIPTIPTNPPNLTNLTIQDTTVVNSTQANNTNNEVNITGEGSLGDAFIALGLLDWFYNKPS